jgi:hypothetical protein
MFAQLPTWSKQDRHGEVSFEDISSFSHDIASFSHNTSDFSRNIDSEIANLTRHANTVSHARALNFLLQYRPR